MIFDQGKKGSCTGNGGAYHKGFQERPSHNGKWLTFSRDFLYTLARALDGIEHHGDDGSTPIAIMKVLQKYGVCLEETLPYNPDPNAKVTIPQKAYDEALQYRIKNYAKAQTLQEMKHAIAIGKTLLSGVIVTDTFMYPEEGGFCGIPGGAIYGGHCINIVDYDDNLEHTYKNGKTYKGFFLFPNSWGEEWGDRGYGYLPYEFIDFVLADFPMHFFLEAWTSIDLDSDPVPAPVKPQPNPQPQQEQRIELWIGKTTAKVNGKDVKLDASPLLVPPGVTMVPVRFVSEAEGWRVAWDGIEQKVTLTK